MHSVALTVEGAVYTTGVNDEAALGRKTGVALAFTSADNNCVACNLPVQVHLAFEMLGLYREMLLEIWRCLSPSLQVVDHGY